MKKYLIVLILSPFLLCFSSPVNNPDSPGYIEQGFFISSGFWMNFRLGYEGEFIANARVKQKQGTERRIDSFKLDSNSGMIVLNIMNRFDLFGVLGEGRVCSDWRVEFPSNVFSRIEMESKYHFKWAIGVKAIFFEWGKTSLSLGGRCTEASFPLLWMTSDGTNASVGDSKMSYSSWQIDLGLSHKIDIFIPYIGVKYSQVKAKISEVPSTTLADDGLRKIDMKNRKSIGFLLGCALTTTQYFALNVEVRLIDEEAFSVSGEFRF